ncbi:MAG: hypothetical protein QOJ07_1898, partial [Thermoleophilaceae bacterium]|nr:hypothetical protein [Thermoleophilaceae bacterium]
MRRALAAAAAAAAALVLGMTAAPPAHAAGTYTVYVCADGNGSGRNNAFSPSSYGAGVTRGSPSCSPGEGLHTQVGNWNGPYYYPEGGSFAACAPAGTTISAYSASEFSAWQGSGFERRVDGGPCGGFALQAAGPLGNTFGAELNTGGYGTWRQSGLAVGGLRFITYCANAAPTPCTGSYAATNWRDVTVTVSDPAKPQLSNGSGVYGTTGWLRGDQSVGFSAADSSGVIVLRADVDRDAAGNAALRFTDDEDVAGHCDWARMAPCRTSESLAPRTIDTTRLPDGEHAVTLYARDSAANSDEARGTFLVDNSPPSAALVRPPGATGRTVTWRPADAGAGIDQASLVAEYATSGGAWQSLQAGTYDVAAGTYSATVPASVAADQVQVRL